MSNVVDIFTGKKIIVDDTQDRVISLSSLIITVDEKENLVWSHNFESAYHAALVVVCLNEIIEELKEEVIFPIIYDDEDQDEI